MLKTVSIFGSTGSIGRSTIEVIQANPERFQVMALVANNNVEKLADQAKSLGARHAIIANTDKYHALKKNLEGTDIMASAGQDAVLEAAGFNVDIVMAAISGIAGLYPLLKTMEKGIDVAIANKEPLVAAGPFVKEAQNKYGSRILPVDSEHNAIFQVLEPDNHKHIDKILLTGSGGPFRESTKDEIRAATLEQALNHPNWAMGPKNTIDSATLMNKALELIEAITLFDVSADQVEIVIHPQSIIHSMVSYTDGSILAQMGAPDMKTPIAHALGYPERLPAGGGSLNLFDLKALTFETPDCDKFPFVTMAYDCYREGQHACVAMNAANEIAVEAALNKQIPFGRIYETVASVLENLEGYSINSLEDVEDFDKTIRERTKSYIL